MSKVIIAVLAAMSMLFIQSVGGTVEGRLFPVMGPLSIYDPEPVAPPAYRMKWRGHAQKRRGCNFVRVEWYLGPRNGRRVQVQFEFTDPPMLRDEGRLEWQGLVISLDPQEVLSHSHADVLHKCPWRPWLTRTRFYDAPGNA